jgi:hypothetical protein
VVDVIGMRAGIDDARPEVGEEAVSQDLGSSPVPNSYQAPYQIQDLTRNVWYSDQDQP